MRFFVEYNPPFIFRTAPTLDRQAQPESARRFVFKPELCGGAAGGHWENGEMTMGEETYDSTQDTLQHIDTVRFYLSNVIQDLKSRAMYHDLSKLQPPEKEAYDILTPRLKGLTYGSEEYRACLREMKPAIQHHYEHNSHHPEHYPDGVAGFDLLDLVEMLCDWKAASLRHADGNILDSITHNIERFKLDPQIASILRNTVIRMGWSRES